MSTESDVEVIRRGYAAFDAGDMATLNELFTEDAVWHVTGAGPLAGAVSLDDVVGGVHHVVALNQNQATRVGEALQQNAVVVYQLRGGRVSEARQYFDDTARNDAFWS